MIEITNIADPRVAQYATLTEAQLRNRLNPANGIFIAESPKVINVALGAGYQPLSLLCEKKHIEGDARDIIERHPGMPVYTGEREVLAGLTGYTLTRGVLCAMRRKAIPEAAIALKDAGRVAVIAGVTDTTNIGSIFRSAAALDIDAVALTRDSCDPLNRRSIRVSMGTVFQVAWTWIDSLQELNACGLKTVALALTHKSVSIDDSQLNAEPRLAMVLGTEGDGLPQQMIEQCDYTARIPMAHGVDSLNVGAAAAVAFWQLRQV